MSGEQRFTWRITCEVELPDSPFASRTVTLDGSVMARVEDAPEFGIDAARKALGAAGHYAEQFPPDGTPTDWRLS